MNHRMGKRIETTDPVVLDVSGLGRIEGRLKNISLSGAAVVCEDLYLLETYLPVKLAFQIRDGRQPAIIRVEGFIGRLSGGLIGIMFMHMTWWRRGNGSVPISTIASLREDSAIAPIAVNDKPGNRGTFNCWHGTCDV